MSELQAAIDAFCDAADAYLEERKKADAAWAEPGFPLFTPWLEKACNASDARDVAKEKWSQAWDALFTLRSKR